MDWTDQLQRTATLQWGPIQRVTLSTSWRARCGRNLLSPSVTLFSKGSDGYKASCLSCTQKPFLCDTSFFWASPATPGSPCPSLRPMLSWPRSVPSLVHLWWTSSAHSLAQSISTCMFLELWNPFLFIGSVWCDSSYVYVGHCVRSPSIYLLKMWPLYGGFLATNTGFMW